MLTIPLNAGIIKIIKTTIDRKRYTLTTKYNSRTGKYCLDVEINKIPLVTGIQLVSGVDLFNTYPEIPLNRVYCINSANPLLDISEEDLGTSGIVVIIEDSDLEV